MSLLYIEKAECRVRSYVQFNRFDDIIDQSHRAVDCMDCEAFLEGGIETFSCIKRTDMIIREAVLTGRISDSPAYDQAMTRLLRDWVKQVDHAEAWIARCERNGYEVANLSEFRNCVSEAYSMLNFSEATESSEAILRLQEEALEEHQRGETAEFVSDEE